MSRIVRDGQLSCGQPSGAETSCRRTRELFTPALDPATPAGLRPTPWASPAVLAAMGPLVVRGWAAGGRTSNASARMASCHAALWPVGPGGGGP